MNGVWVHMRAQSLSSVQFFATPWTIALQAPGSMEFSRQEYYRGLLLPPPRIFSTRGLNLHLLSLLHQQADSLPVPPGKPLMGDFGVKRDSKRSPPWQKTVGKVRAIQNLTKLYLKVGAFINQRNEALFCHQKGDLDVLLSIHSMGFF